MTVAVIESRKEVAGAMETTLKWVELILHYIEQYRKVACQRNATNFLLNVVQ